MLSSLIKKIAGRAVKLVVAVVILGAGFALYNLLVETRAVVEPVSYTHLTLPTILLV